MNISIDDENNKNNSKKHLRTYYYSKTSIMALAAAILLLFPAFGSNYGSSSNNNYSALAQSLIYDDFSDNQIDSSKWTKGQDGIVPPLIEETNQRVEITFPPNAAGPTFGAGYESVCELTGDFDIQVSYDLLQWPPHSGVRAGLGIVDGSSYWSLQRISLGTHHDYFHLPRGEYYVTDYNGHTVLTNTADFSGKLRLVRTGDIVTAYAGEMPLNKAVVTTGDLKFNIVSWSHDYAFTHQPVKVAFDNFVVNKGTFANCDLNPNQPPTANAGNPQTVNEGDSVTLDGSASTDPDGDTLTYAWTQTSGTTITLSDTSSATPSFTAPDVDEDGDTLTFELTVDDGNGQTATDSVSITVHNVVVNQPPTANAGADQSVDEGDSVTLDGSASSDSDGTIQSYSWTQTGGPSVTLTDANTATPSFTAPDVDEDGDTLTFELTVADDGGKTATDTVDVAVNNVVIVVNQPPTASAGDDQTVNEGDNVELSGSGSSDPDGHTLTYSWTQTAGTQVTLSGEDTASPSFTAPDVDEDGDTLTFELTVDDGNGHTATDSVDIVVQDVPDEQVTEYTIEGFYPPVDMGSEENPVVNTVKSGRSVALKFEVFDQNNVEQTTTTDVIDSSTQNRIECSTLEGNPADAVETTNTGGTTLRYDTDGGTFLQNWKTPSGEAGNCYSTTVTTVDGSSITAYFKLN